MVYYGNRTTRRTTRVTKRVFTNTNKMRKQKAVAKARKAPIKAIVKNTQLIKGLKSRVNGQIQKQYQYTGGLNPVMSHPIAFQVNNFYEHNPIYIGDVNANSGVATNTVHARFAKTTTDFDISDSHDWLMEWNKDEVSKISYLPVSCKFNFDFRVENFSPMQEPIRVQITLFKMRGYAATADHDYALPDHLGAYWHMLNKEPTNRNHFNPKYHNVLYSKWVTIRPRYAGVIDDPTSNVANWTYGKEIYRPDVNAKVSFTHYFRTNKQIKGDFMGAETIQTCADKLHLRMLKNEPIWCLISTDATTSTVPSGQGGGGGAVQQLTCRIERQLVWRDPHGTS